MIRSLVGTIVLLAVLAAIAGCSSTDEPGDKPFFQRQFLLGAHRAGAFVLPENTVEGFKEAAKRWPGILLEADAGLTADGHVVLLHDETVERTTGSAGKINEMTLAEVKELDAGHYLSLDGEKTFPYRGKGITIATLKEALQAVPDSHFLIEFKWFDGIVDAVVRDIREVGAEDRVLLASFLPAHMNRARELAPEIATCYDYENGAAMLEALRNGAWASYEPQADVLSLMRRMVDEFNLTKEELLAIRAKGVRFQIHTVDTPEEIRHYLDLGVDSILSDRPDVLTKVVAEWQESQRS
ncbi:MAG: hypothetical protein GY851_23540 [bacterium]|nr:hypothetical protein [bacterium]